MAKMIRVGVAAAALVWAASASAQMYKCVHDGRTSFQEQPCDAGGSESRLATFPRPQSWPGCYLSDKSPWGDGKTREPTRIEVLGRPERLGVKLGTDPEPLALRPLSSLQTAGVQSSIASQMPGLRVVEGVGHVDSTSEPPFLGLYRIQEGSGRERLVLVVGGKVGFLERVACGPR
jgi:hypothetical protein